MRTVRATRYVTPLREGGSLPGIVEGDDLGTYVCKFRGAGQGLRVLVAEVIVGELGRLLGLAVPDLVVIDLDPAIARYEADEEVQDLLNASLGSNLGIDFLPGAFGFDSGCTPDPEVAARVLWLDALTANVDRSWRNPNLLLWHGNLWVIDHGAALYFHHGWAGGVGAAERFAEQKWNADDHVFREHAAELPAADAELRGLLGPEVFADVLALVPDGWLEPVPGAEDPPTLRVTLKNDHPSATYTLLKWGTPLDDAALNTGVFKITDASSGAEVEQLTMQIRRRMPPGQSQLAGVKPGEEESVEVVFNRPWMPEAKPASYRVRAEGTLKGAWDKGKEEVSDDETNEYTESPLAGKTFVTNEVVLVVE